MYQENILRAHKAEDPVGSRTSSTMAQACYAPANDPFVTASILSDLIEKESQRKYITNLYLSPLGTKAQTLGFGLYFVWECREKPISIIFPFCKEYSRETTYGISKIWKYSIELPV